MTEFKKYPSIENHYQQKFIGHFGDNFGIEIFNQQFIVREKLDGANIQLVFTPNKPMKAGRRTEYLVENESFMDIWNTLKKYGDFLSLYQEKADTRNNILRVYGEIYGIGINKRIDYGKEKYISIFDVMINDEFVSQAILNEQFEIDGFDHLLPKIYGIFSSLPEALQISLPDNTEGAVIQPLNQVYFSPLGSRFIIKKKAEDFDDKRTPLKVIEENNNVSALNIEFRGYINDNRIKDTFSKYGEIERPQQIPDYIKYVLEDAKADFLKIHDLKELIPHFEIKHEREVFNVGSSIVNYLKKYL